VDTTRASSAPEDLAMNTIHPSPTRRGTALVIATVVIVMLAGMAISLTNLTVSRYGEQQRRQDQVRLLAAVESCSNEAISWVRNDPTYSASVANSGAIYNYLKNMPLSPHAFPTNAGSTAVLMSGSLPSTLMYQLYTVDPKWVTVFPVLSGSGNGLNFRNSCAVEARIIKVAGGVPSTWDGSERFVIYATATAGDASRPETVRRERIELVIKVDASSSTNYPFRRALFSQNGYDFSGTATTDSWKSDKDGDGIHETPYVAPASYGAIGGINTSGDLGSNGSLGSGVYDTSKVHGTAYPNAAYTLPTVTYNPPSITVQPKVTGDVTYSGAGTGTTTEIRVAEIAHKNGDAITIKGDGTVKIYVDGAFNVGDITFAAGSTAKLEIYQNSASGKGASFNAKNSIGDPNDPSRFLFVTAFTGTGSNEMSLNGGASFSGVVIAPYAGIKFNGGSDFYGSFIAKDFSSVVNGNFKFHYDISLANVPYGVTVTKPSFNTAAYHSHVMTYGEQ
jgi:hypothetical protein